jgi:hypothetical protein
VFLVRPSVDAHRATERDHVMRIKLYTKEGIFVAEEEIPHQSFHQTPDVILWGTRVFCLPSVDEDAVPSEDDVDQEYVEAFAYAVVRAAVPRCDCDQGDAVQELMLHASDCARRTRGGETR